MDNCLSLKDFCQIIDGETCAVDDLANRLEGKNLRRFERVLALLEDARNPNVYDRMVRADYRANGDGREAGIYVWDGRRARSYTREKFLRSASAEGLHITGTSDLVIEDGGHFVFEDHAFLKSGLYYDVSFIRVAPRSRNY